MKYLSIRAIVNNPNYLARLNKSIGKNYTMLTMLYKVNQIKLGSHSIDRSEEATNKIKKCMSEILIEISCEI